MHCHHQHDSCIKMRSDEIHFNVSLIVRDKVTNKTLSTDHNFFLNERRAKRIRTEVLLLTSLSLTARPNRLTCDGEQGDLFYYGWKLC